MLLFYIEIKELIDMQNMGVEELNKVRKERGMEIAKTSRIVRTEKGWTVPSQNGNGNYTVISNGFEVSCTCPDYENRKEKCKHVWAVELTVTKEVDIEGNVTLTQTVRKTYTQNWHNYNISQQQEKEQFMKLLSDNTFWKETLSRYLHSPSIGYNYGD